MLTQGPTDLLSNYPSNGQQPASTEDVNGHSAEYLDNGSDGSNRLQWEQDGEAFVLASFPGCEGDTPTSKEALLEFARALRVPT